MPKNQGNGAEAAAVGQGKDASKLPGGKAGGAASAARPAKDRHESSKKAGATQSKDMRGPGQDCGQEIRGSSWKAEREDDKVMQEAAREGDEDGQRTEDAIEKADADFNPDDPDVEGLPENDAAEVDNEEEDVADDEIADDEDAEAAELGDGGEDLTKEEQEAADEVDRAAAEQGDEEDEADDYDEDEDAEQEAEDDEEGDGDVEKEEKPKPAKSKGVRSAKTNGQSGKGGKGGERTKEERSAAAKKGAETRKRRAAEAAAAGQNGKAKSSKKAK